MHKIGQLVKVAENLQFIMLLYKSFYDHSFVMKRQKKQQLRIFAGKDNKRKSITSEHDKSSVLQYRDPITKH